jgi:hypothetical protein
MVLVLYACGFSPLDWLGPKDKRSVLVVPGTPSGERRKAFFLAIPLFCRLASSGVLSREAARRRTSNTFGILISVALPVMAAAAALRYLQSLPAACVLSGAALCLLVAVEWVRGDDAAPARNLAVRWAERYVPPDAQGAIPFVLVYTGDVSELKFFLAKYRRHVFRGQGIFAEFAEGSCGAAAVSDREGPLVSYRVDPALFALVRAAAQACGVRNAAARKLGFLSGGRIAMSRGFRAVTVFRADAASAEEEGLSDERASAWLSEIASAGGGPLPPKGGGQA